MGHLVCLKRYWRIASDEFFISGFCLYIIRFIWFVLVIITLGFSASRVANCQYGGLILFYLAISIILIYLSILIEYYIIKISMQDTICENEKRDQSIIKFILARLGLCVSQILTAIFGCLVIATQSQIPCSNAYKYAENNVDLVLLSIVVISQLIEGSLIFCCCFCMSSRSIEDDSNTEIILNKSINHHNHNSQIVTNGNDSIQHEHEDSSSSQIDSSDVDHTYDHMAASDPTPSSIQNQLQHQPPEEENEDDTIFTWPLQISRNKFFETALRYLFRCFQTSTCNLFGGNNVMDNTFEELSEIVTSYFHHDGFLDIVPSDVITGLILCYQQQLEWKRHHNIYSAATFASSPTAAATTTTTTIVNPSSSSSSSSPSSPFSLVISNSIVAINNNHSSPSSIPTRTSTTPPAAPLVYSDESYDNIERGLGYHGGNQIRQLNPIDSKDRKLILDAYRYSSLALSMNTHLWVCVMHPVTASCRLCYTNLRHTDGPCNCFCPPCYRTPIINSASTKSIVATPPAAARVAPTAAQLAPAPVTPSLGPHLPVTGEIQSSSSSSSSSNVVLNHSDSDVDAKTTIINSSSSSSSSSSIINDDQTPPAGLGVTSDEAVSESSIDIRIRASDELTSLPSTHPAVTSPTSNTTTSTITTTATTTTATTIATTPDTTLIPLTSSPYCESSSHTTQPPHTAATTDSMNIDTLNNTSFNTDIEPTASTLPPAEVAIGGSEIVTYPHTNNGCCCCFTPNLFLCNTKELYAKVHKSHYYSHHHHRKVLNEKLITGDNCMRANESGLLRLVHDSGNDSELKFASFHNDIHIKPYAIFYDRKNNSIVIAVRGTLSIEDAITDVICHATELTAVGVKWGYALDDVENRYAHRGMLMAAARIREDIERVGLLHQLMNDDKKQSMTTDNSMNVNMNNANNTNMNNTTANNMDGDYTPRQLVVTGHSLGAGVATILAYLLKPTYASSLTCITFGTPNTVFDTVTAQEVTPYVTSICNQHDMICRAGYKPTVKMRADILDCIARAKTNKATVLKSGFFRKKSLPLTDLMYSSAATAAGGAPTGLATGETLSNSGEGVVTHNNNNNNNSSSSSSSLPVDNAYRASLRKYIALMNHRIKPKHFVDLAIPGRVIQINRKGDNIDDDDNDDDDEGSNTKNSFFSWLTQILHRHRHRQRDQYIAYESHYLNYSSFELHPDMGLNHMPHHYERVLKSIAQEWEKITPPPGVSSTPPPGVSSTPPPGVSSTPPPGVSSTPPPGVSSTSPPGVSSTPPPGV